MILIVFFWHQTWLRLSCIQCFHYHVTTIKRNAKARCRAEVCHLKWHQDSLQCERMGIAKTMRVWASFSAPTTDSARSDFKLAKYCHLSFFWSCDQWPSSSGNFSQLCCPCHQSMVSWPYTRSTEVYQLRVYLRETWEGGLAQTVLWHVMVYCTLEKFGKV